MLKNKKLLAILPVIILMAVLLPQHSVSADDILGCPFSITSCLADINSLILSGLGSAIGWAAGLLDSFIQYQTSNAVFGVKVVDDSWTIMRNFVNMFFILVLIIMAFGTIFNIKKYTWQEMLAPFLISALLINFSLAIGQYIITISNGLAGVFLKQVGSVSAMFGQGTSLGALVTSGQADIITGVSSVIISEAFSIIFLAVVFLALFSTALFSVVRIFMLWFLLIISPIAWFGYALPNLRQKTWSDWWKQFFCWCFFLPYYLFFLMFAVIFIAGKNSFPPASGATFPGISLVVNDFMAYGLSLVFLIGGLAMARKLACASGTGVSMAFGKIETGVRKYAPGAAYVRGAKEGLKERGAEIQEKGLLGFGGTQRARLDEATAKGWVAGVPGPGQVPGAREARSRAESAEVDKEFKKLQTLNLTLDDLNKKFESSRGLEKIAALKLKLENGWATKVDADEIAKQIRAAGGGRTALGASIIASGKKGKFQEMALGTKDKEDVFNKFLGEDLELAKAFGLDMSDSRELMSETLATKLLDLYSGDTLETKKKVEESVKNNIENMAKDAASRKDLVNGIGAFAGVDDRIRKLAGQIITEKKEVGSWKLRNQVLKLNGGINSATGEALTVEGRGLAKDIADGNVAIKEESEYRKTRPAIIASADLNTAQRIEVEDQIIANIKSGLIRSLDTEDLKSPAIFNALVNGKTSGLLMAVDYNKALGLVEDKKTGALEIRGKPDRNRRRAINAIVTATGPMPYP